VIWGEPVRARDYRLCRDLLYALERARSRLAVAIAAENKVTPRRRWRHYLETEDRMRRCVQEIRRRHDPGLEKQSDCLQVLNLLRQPFPAADRHAEGEAQLLCRRLYEVLAIVEGTLSIVPCQEMNPDSEVGEKSWSRTES
jgi:chromatin segregation and condensation protein Rec8/ScpA/Scc1 (kleisin family)